MHDASSEKLDLPRIEQALEMVAKADRYFGGRALPEFLQDEMVGDAVLMCLMVIGETMRHVSPELRAEFPEIEWRDVISVRHRVAHDYFGISYELIWLICSSELPKLRVILTSMHQKLSS